MAKLLHIVASTCLCSGRELITSGIILSFVLDFSIICTGFFPYEFINYMQLIESLPTYGIHYYEVKDKAGIPWLLGLSFKGIGQYDRLDKVTPRKVFPWRQLQNIYFKEKKFSIEVNDPKRGSQSSASHLLYEQPLQDTPDSVEDSSETNSDFVQGPVTKRPFSSSNVIVHAWYGTAALIKSIWSMAINQHQFYLDRKHSKMQHPMSKSFSQIATDLTQSTPSITSQNSDISETSSSTNSLTMHKDQLKGNPLNADMAAMSAKAEEDLVAALKARKAALEEHLKSKQEEFKKMCLKEAEILGVLPPDYPKEPGEPLPVIRKRVGTAFTLSEKLMNGSTEEDFSKELAQFEKEYEIQSNICKAALRLSMDPTITKKSRKTRRENYKLALRKLEEIGEKLNEIRLEHGLEPITPQVVKSGYDTLPRPSKPKTPPVSRTFNVKGLKTKGESERGRAKTTESKGVRARSKSVPRPHLNGGLTLPSPLRSRKRDNSLPRESTPGDIEFEDEDFMKQEQYSSQTLGRVPRSTHGLPPQKPTTDRGKFKVNPDYAEIGPPRQRSDSNPKPRSKTMVNPYIPSSPNSNARPVLRQSSSFRGSSSSNSDFSDTSSRKQSIPYDSHSQHHNYSSLPRQKISGIDYSQSNIHYSSEDEQPRIRQHASSMFNLPTQTQKVEYNYSDDGISYDQPISTVQTQSPKKHGSVGNLRSENLPPERLADETDQYMHNTPPRKDYRVQKSRPRQPRYDHDDLSRRVYESREGSVAYSSDDQYSTGSGDRTAPYRGGYTNREDKNYQHREHQQYQRNHVRDNHPRHGHGDYYAGEQYRGGNPRNSPHSGRYPSPSQQYQGGRDAWHHDPRLDYKDNQYDHYQNGVHHSYSNTYYHEPRHDNPQYYHNENGENSHYKGSSYDVRAAYAYHYQRQNSHEDYFSDRSSNYSDHSREYLEPTVSYGDRQGNYMHHQYQQDQYMNKDPRLRNEYAPRNEYAHDYQTPNDYGAYQPEPMSADPVYVQSHRTISVDNVQPSIPEPQPAEFKTATTMIVRPTTTYSSNLVVSKTMYQPVARMTCEPVAPDTAVPRKSSSSSSSLNSFTNVEDKDSGADAEHEGSMTSEPAIIHASPTPGSSSDGSHLEEDANLGNTLTADAIDDPAHKKGSSTLV
ncbi:FERM domain-containing protein 4A-like [Anneissia japonica]|uniref:FERM domain-containing protein 4A-like n=1 Tax=Anneissia japonica TaxID=1529436 RepID=UPI0014259609|nr:FERM domain-containing protein 4A-like [Anneissia japonica]